MQYRGLLCVVLTGVVVAAACRTAAAIEIPVGDSSFEGIVVASSAEPQFGPGAWGRAWGGGFADSSFRPPVPLYPNQDGDYLGNIFLTDEGVFAALYQDTARIEEGTYTFTVAVGHEPNAEPVVAPFQINFEAVGYGGGTVLLAENSYPVGTVDSSGLTDVVATLEIPAGHPEIGRILRPVLLTTGADSGSNPSDPRASYMMDNVRLELAPAAGPSRSLRVGQPSFDPPIWNTPYGSGGNATLFRPESQLFASQTGDQLAALTMSTFGGWGAAFWQDTVPIEAGTYSLTVGVAHDPNFEPTVAPFAINFESVSESGAVTLLGENLFPVGSANSIDLTDLTATLEIPAGMPNIGETLRIVLLMVGDDAGSDPSASEPHATYYLDDVRLSFAPGEGSLLAADFDNNGVVDGADLEVWQNSYGLNVDADANGDSVTDGRDFLIWQRQFGMTASAANTVAVPEPSAVVLVVAGLVLVGSRRYRGECQA